MILSITPSSGRVALAAMGKHSTAREESHRQTFTFLANRLLRNFWRLKNSLSPGKLPADFQNNGYFGIRLNRGNRCPLQAAATRRDPKCCCCRVGPHA
jgi:hypothetical protein